MARKYMTRKHQARQQELDSDCTALYIRVSTERQADEGFSLDAQRAKLEAYCAAQDWRICPDHIYIDAGVSGKSTDRAAFKAMMDAAKVGSIRRIVAMKLDRLARNVKDFLTTVDQLKDWGCALVLVKESFDTSTPHGKFALTMFAAMAELEAATITERVMTGKAQKASTGGYNGSRCPIGYTYEAGQFTVNEDQAETVRRIFTLFNAGVGLNEIARQLNDSATPTATGKGDWTGWGVSHILRNGFYAGIAQWDGVETEGDHPSIISRDVYDQAQRRVQTLRRGRQPTLIR